MTVTGDGDIGLNDADIIRSDKAFLGVADPQLQNLPDVLSADSFQPDHGGSSFAVKITKFLMMLTVTAVKSYHRT
jgi:hypothetical protein